MMEHSRCRYSTFTSLLIAALSRLCFRLGSIVGDLQGKDCSHNPLAFPPSLVVRCRKVLLQGRRR
jgi:hypothetical protein